MSERKGKGPKTEKMRDAAVERLVQGMRTETENIRSRPENTGGCVKLTTQDSVLFIYQEASVRVRAYKLAWL